MLEPDPFYVGYAPRTPAPLGHWLRPRVLGLVALGLALAVLLAAAQRPFAPAVFEYGFTRDFEGVVRERPYPTLVVERPGAAETSSRYLLVRPGKHGAAGEVRGLDGRRVRLRGSLVHRDDQTMIEIEEGSLLPLAGAAAAAEADVELGLRTLRGEIVDSKCFLGVMKPGNLKPHRDCAVRCISGGVPPVLYVRDAQGAASYVLLAGAEGESIGRALLSLVAEPVEITGQLRRIGTQLVLQADPATYRRLE